MNTFDKLEKLASIYFAQAQVLNFGESSLSLNDMKKIAINLMLTINQLIKDNKISHHIYSWTNPADKLLKALELISNGSQLDSNLKASALEDYNQNVSFLLSSEDKSNLEKLFNTYNSQ